MWYFNSPRIVFGEDALTHLAELKGRQAFIVTDATMHKLGFTDKVAQTLAQANIPCAVFAEVEPEPSLQTVRRAAEAMHASPPDWVIGLGGGSAIDAAKAAWLIYERPDLSPESINPFDNFGLRAKARLIAIPTTSGTGSEVTWATVLTDTEAQRKLALAARELLPDLAIVDPLFVMSLPPTLTADTGLDALTHAVEGYASAWRNDFSDGMCLKAIQLIFTHLPRAVADGADKEAREHMHNAATIAGLGFGNSMTGLAHAMGHAIGALFHIPHGQAVSLCLPFTMEFTANAGGSRYYEIARFLHLPAHNDLEGAISLIAAIRALRHKLGRPATLRNVGVEAVAFYDAMPQLLANAETDTDMVASPRLPSTEELKRLFECVYDGLKVEF
jgi:alcohol dehydrogenase class IV